MTIDELLNEWSKDTVIDQTEPGRELAKIPGLHAKYLRILTHHKLVSEKLTREFKSRRKILYEYYRGDLNDKETLEDLGLPPFAKRLTPQALDLYIDSDQSLNDILTKKMLHDEIISICNLCLKELQQRNWTLKSMIDWERFINAA